MKDKANKEAERLMEMHKCYRYVNHSDGKGWIDELDYNTMALHSIIYVSNTILELNPLLRMIDGRPYDYLMRRLLLNQEVKQILESKLK